MADTPDIIGLKLEKGEVLADMSDEPGVFKPAPTSMISKVEQILMTLSSKSTWPNKSKKENIIFESEKNIGSGLFKDFYDKDGDKTFHFEAIEKKKVHLNEDQEFGFEAYHQEPEVVREDSIKDVELNSWGVGPDAKDEKKNEEVFTPPYEFEKRPSFNRSDEISKLRDKMMHMGLQNLTLTKQTYSVTPTPSVDRRSHVSYKARKKFQKESGYDGLFCISLYKYSSKKKVENVPESKFYLKKK